MVLVGRPTAVSWAALLFPRPTAPLCLQPPSKKNKKKNNNNDPKSHCRSAGWTAIILSQRFCQWIRCILVCTDGEGRYRRRRSIIFWPSLGFAILVTIGTTIILMNGASFFNHGTTARYYDGLVQRLNLLLGTQRSGQGREVRAVLPITVRPTTTNRAEADRTIPFVGRRCQMTESSSFFRDDYNWWWWWWWWWWRRRRREDRSSSWIRIDCEECTADGQCSALLPRDGGTTFRRQKPLAVVDASSSTVAHVTSQYNSKSAETIAYWKVISPPTTAANDQQQQHQERPAAVYNFHPHCSIEACWDLQRCRRRRRRQRETTNDTDGVDFVMTVHVLVWPSTMTTTTPPSDLVERFTRALLESNHNTVEMVANPQHACLVVVLVGNAADGHAASNDDDYDDDNVATTIDAAAIIGNGQNLLVWDVVSILGGSSPHGILHYGKAAFASRHQGGTQQAWMRLGYDIVLPPLDYAAEPKVVMTVDSSVPPHNDQVLLACAVTTNAGDGLAAFIAHQYWRDEPEGGGEEENWAAIRPLCREMDTNGPDHAVMANATFTFLPDDSPSSLLFPTIVMGSIPVVMNLAMLPFWPDVPFDQCVYLVDPTRIVDLPRLLGQVPAAEIQERRSICRRLGRRVFGGDAEQVVDRDAHSFLVAVSTMRERILRAQQLRNALFERS